MMHILKPNLRTSAPLSLIFFLLTSLSSCKKEYINGDLDGQWRIEEITLDGQPQTPDEALYWNFSFHVVQLSRFGGPVATGNLSFDGSSIEVDFPFIESSDGNESISAWGVYSNPTTFTLDNISSSRLTMRDGNVVIKMHKY